MSSVLESLDTGEQEAISTDESDTFQLMTLRLGGQLFGIDLGATRVVVPLAGIAVVPGAPSHVLGVMNHRGGIVPVIDLRAPLGLQAGPLEPDAKVMIVESKLSEGGVGCVFESLEDIVTVSARDIQPAPPNLGAAAARYIAGAIEVYGELVGLLEPRGFDEASA